MKKKKKKFNWTSCVAGRRKWIWLGAVLLVVVVMVVNAAAGKDIRLWWVLRGLDDDPPATQVRIQEMGLSYRGALKRALVRGGRGYNPQYNLCEIALLEPFLLHRAVVECLASDDPDVSRPAADVLLRLEAREPPFPPGPVPDGILPVLEDWCREPGHPQLRSGLSTLLNYRDDRLIEILLPLVTMEVNDQGTDVLEVGRTNASREMAVRAIAAYLHDERVEAALTEVAKRVKEVDSVHMELTKSLTAGNFSADLEVYWALARSKNDLVRQMLASHLDRVTDPRVIPILVYLVGDETEIVRRNALGSLATKRARVLMENLHLWGEDEYEFIRGDLAMAVDMFRDRSAMSYVIHCLADRDRQVVEKAIVTLFRMTGKHHGFDEATWEAYTWNRHLEGGTKGKARSELIQAFINSGERREQALAKWWEDYPPAYGDAERVPYLIRTLAHRDSRNVKRALREIHRIKGWTEGLPEKVLDRTATVDEEADAIFTFMQSDREKLVEELLKRLE